MFPTVLLVTTLLRLSLNVASTRVVLIDGHTGPDAAGKVIEAFGHFLVGGNYAVGIVVFVILVVINFVVITKGAGRIAEVGARFTLDAMPGKQMAIDADLNAGLIGEDEARKRRAGGRAGSRLLRLDGRRQQVRARRRGRRHHDPAHQHRRRPGRRHAAARPGIRARRRKNYTLLAIGDGLVAQIPALIISTAAGLVVTRVAASRTSAQQLVDQLFAKPQVLYITGGIIGVHGPDPRHAALRVPAARRGARRRRLLAAQARAAPARPQAAAAAAPAAAQPRAQEASWEDVMPVDMLGLEVGYRLIPLVDKAQDGELLRAHQGASARSSRRRSASCRRRCTSATTWSCARRLPHHAQRRGGRAAAKSLPGSSSRSIPARVSGTLPGTHDHRSGVRPAGGLDRAAHARAGAGHGLHRGRCRHRGRDPPEPADPRRTPPNCSAARKCSSCSTTRQGDAEADRRPGAEAGAAGDAAESAANARVSGLFAIFTRVAGRASAHTLDRTDDRSSSAGSGAPRSSIPPA